MSIDKTLTAANATYHHSAWARGYISRKASSDTIEPYSGKYGTGYKVHSASTKSTRYHQVTYYIVH